jgi:hypothetical protein
MGWISSLLAPLGLVLFFSFFNNTVDDHLTPSTTCRPISPQTTVPKMKQFNHIHSILSRDLLVD